MSLSMTALLVVVAACGDDGAGMSDEDLGAAGDGEGADAAPGDADAALPDAAVEDAAPEPDPIAFEQVYAILTGSCGGVICHVEQDAGGLMMADAEMAYRALLDEQGDCEVDRVVPGDADSSLLVQKLEGSQDCGLMMPFNRDPLPAEDIRTIRDWIDMGAPEG